MRYLSLSLFWLLGAAVVTAYVGTPNQSLEAEKLGRVANEFRSRLKIPAKVQVVIVAENQRLASARSLTPQSQTYLLELDRTFLATLTEEEKRAIIAHEMGHVWIFTHHPYLQTETLANSKAELLVPQRNLVKVYEKVWVLDGKPGNLGDYVSHRLGITVPEQSSSSPVTALLPDPPDGQQ